MEASIVGHDDVGSASMSHTNRQRYNEQVISMTWMKTCTVSAVSVNTVEADRRSKHRRKPDSQTSVHCFTVYCFYKWFLLLVFRSSFSAGSCFDAFARKCSARSLTTCSLSSLHHHCTNTKRILLRWVYLFRSSLIDYILCSLLARPTSSAAKK